MGYQFATAPVCDAFIIDFKNDCNDKRRELVTSRTGAFTLLLWFQSNFEQLTRPTYCSMNWTKTTIQFNSQFNDQRNACSQAAVKCILALFKNDPVWPTYYFCQVNSTRVHFSIIGANVEMYLIFVKPCYRESTIRLDEYSVLHRLIVGSFLRLEINNACSARQSARFPTICSFDWFAGVESALFDMRSTHFKFPDLKMTLFIIFGRCGVSHFSLALYNFPRYLTVKSIRKSFIKMHYIARCTCESTKELRMVSPKPKYHD
jgi:hypothetical protein